MSSWWETWSAGPQEVSFKINIRWRDFALALDFTARLKMWTWMSKCRTWWQLIKAEEMEATAAEKRAEGMPSFRWACCHLSCNIACKRWHRAISITLVVLPRLQRHPSEPLVWPTSKNHYSSYDKHSANSCHARGLGASCWDDRGEEFKRSPEPPPTFPALLLCKCNITLSFLPAGFLHVCVCPRVCKCT